MRKGVFCYIHKPGRPYMFDEELPGIPIGVKWSEAVKLCKAYNDTHKKSVAYAVERKVL